MLRLLYFRREVYSDVWSLWMMSFVELSLLLYINRCVILLSHLMVCWKHTLLKIVQYNRNHVYLPDT